MTAQWCRCTTTVLTFSPVDPSIGIPQHLHVRTLSSSLYNFFPPSLREGLNMNLSNWSH